jgi:UDP-3-O-[3-hydroxymyristoyl] N-acetylglucosamine deacetylase
MAGIERGVSQQGRGERVQPQAGPILIVDDEKQIRGTLQGILNDEGFAVLEAEEGQQALKFVANEPLSLVILDIWMPQGDGIELLEKIKQHTPELPVVMISGHGTIETAVRATKLGATDFIEKPFSIDTLLQTVYRALGQEAGKQQAAPRFKLLRHSLPTPRQARPELARRLEGSADRRTGSTSSRQDCRNTLPKQTIKRSVVRHGQGLHSGVKTGLILHPLPPGSGIIFGSISSDVTIPAHLRYVESTEYATTLCHDGMVARTVEHLLAALHGYGITDLLVKMQNEMPVLDGSALDFCEMLEEASIKEQGEETEEIVIDRPYSIGDPERDEKFIMIEPANCLEAHYTLDYPLPVGREECTYIHRGPDSFRKEIAPARTFGFLKDIEKLERMGLGGGGRLHNCILIGERGIINPPLRFPDELVRHKVLDLIGDLYLLGRPLRGRVTACRTGHGDNAALLQEIREGMGL